MKYTAIWQQEGLYERDWPMHLCGPYISDHVTD